MVKEYVSNDIAAFIIAYILDFVLVVGSIIVGYIGSGIYLIIGIAYMKFFQLLGFAVFLTMNSMCTRIIIDTNKKIISRRGYVFGYHLSINFDDVLHVEAIYVVWENTYLIFIDEKNKKMPIGSKNSYIRIPYSIDNENFLLSCGFKIIDKRIGRK